jgi:hypothetical protein
MIGVPANMMPLCAGKNNVVGLMLCELPGCIRPLIKRLLKLFVPSPENWVILFPSSSVKSPAGIVTEEDKSRSEGGK